MKNLILASLFSLMFSQAEVSQKTYDVQIDNSEVFTLSELIPEYDLDWALINIVYCESEECSLQIYYNYDNGSSGTDPETKHYLRNANDGNFNEYYYYYNTGNSSSFYVEAEQTFLIQVYEASNVKLLVTAEFPEEDTGYIQEGHEFRLLPGQNLVSFPCEKTISLESAIPEQALDNMASIIGQGVATQPLPNGIWVGSLDSLEATRGYWFKATTEVSFEYTCIE